MDQSINPEASTAKGTDSGSPASLLSTGQGRLTCLVAACVLEGHAEAMSMPFEWLREDPRRCCRTPKAFQEMRLRDTVRRGAEPGRGELSCRRRKQILPSAVSSCACSRKSCRRQELKYSRRQNGRRNKDLRRTRLWNCECRSPTTETVSSHAVALNESAASKGDLSSDQPRS